MYLESSVFWLRAAVLLYGVGLVQVLWTVLRQRQQWYELALNAFSIGVVLHFVSLTELGLHYRGIPVTNFYETASLCAFLNACAFLVVQRIYRFEGLAVFLFPLVFLFAAIGATELPVAPWSNGGVRGILLTTHILLVLIGYAAMLLTAVASIFYLIQERNLKQKTRSVLFERLPALSSLDDVVSNSMSWGFVFITLAVIAGVFWGFIESGTAWIRHGEVWISLLTWALYLVMVFLRVTAGWRGRKAALMAITVLGASALTWVSHIGLRRLVTQ